MIIHGILGIYLWWTPDCFLWLFEMDRHTLTRITFEGDSHSPQWSADGLSVLAGIESSTIRALYRVAIDGASAPEKLWSAEGPVYPYRGPADGSVLPLDEEANPQNHDIWVLPMSPEGKAEPFLHSTFNERTPMFSPDGKWIAYRSNESGRDEVYIRAYPSRGQRTQISMDGGSDPLWSRDGKELFFVHEKALYSVSIATEPSLIISAPRKILDSDFVSSRALNYDVSLD